MFNRYFQQELAYLKDLGEEFSKAYPAVAPMLSGASADPDVERLLEGVAFLTGLLRQKLDDEFPEIIHEMIQLIWPHYLRPLPCSTVMAFKPKPNLKQMMTVPAGTQVASVPIEGTTCLFQTCYDVQLHPLTIIDASFAEAAGHPPSIKLILELNGLALSEWDPQQLRFYLSGNLSHAVDLYFILRQYLREILISPVEKGSSCLLSSECLKPGGFSNDESLIPYPSNSFPGYRILQEYFILPEKFLYLDLTGWEKWMNRGEGSRFEISFQLDALPFPPPRIKTEDFVLFATPAVNIFPHEAAPVRLDHHKSEYLIRPSGSKVSHYQVYAIENVVGYIQGTAKEKQYVPFDYFTPENRSDSVYNVVRRNSPVRSGSDVYLNVAYSEDSGLPIAETLSIQTLCTNGFLPENLQLGDIHLPTSSSPSFADFSNIRHPTVNILPPLEGNLLWRLLSHLSLNYSSLANEKNLRAILSLYVFEGSRDRTSILANQKRISGIEKVVSKASDRLISGVMRSGREIQIKARHDHFAGMGDLYLFGSVLDYFLGAYASINTFTKLIIEDIVRGEIYTWPERIGDHPLV